jgi:hypothetical protein
LSIASRCLYLAISSFSSAVKCAFIVYPLRVHFGLSPRPLLCVLLGSYILFIASYVPHKL